MGGDIMRPGMVPGTPEAQSPSHHSPSHSLPGFPGTGPDPYHQMPSTPRPGDPYAMPPPTPRGQEYGGPPGTPRGPGVDPFGQQRNPGDPYGQPPSTPRPEHGSPQDQFRSPVRNPDQFGHSPNMPHASEPYMVSPGGPRPYPGVGPRMSMPPVPNWPGVREPLDCILYGNAGKVYAREALKMVDGEDSERCSYQCYYGAFNGRDRDCFFHTLEAHPDKVLKLKKPRTE